jgi:hypothetical protein
MLREMRLIWRREEVGRDNKFSTVSSPLKQGGGSNIVDGSYLEVSGEYIDFAEGVMLEANGPHGLRLPHFHLNSLYY